MPLSLVAAKIEVDDNFEIEKKANVFLADYSKITFPLELRKWKDGDWFVPLGMKGRKKLSDYFNDNKFSIIDKENVWLLCSGDDIIWIVGHRADDRYKVTDVTQEVYKLQLI